MYPQRSAGGRSPQVPQVFVTRSHLFILPDSTFEVDATCNWFFMIASTFLCALVIGFVSNKLVEPRFGKYEGASDAKLEEITPQQRKGLHAAGIAAIVYIALIAVLFFMGPLAGENGAFVGSPLIKGLIPISLVLQLAWIIFVIIWCIAGIPIVPGVGMYLPAGVL